jgi:hypothetical protein
VKKIFMASARLLITMLIIGLMTLLISHNFDISPVISFAIVLIGGIVAGKSAGFALLETISPDITKALEELKTSLETSFTEKSKKVFDEKIKALEEQIKTADSTELIKGLKAELDKLKADAELNQPVIDAFVAAKANKSSDSNKPVSFDSMLKDAFDKSHDDIQKFIRKESRKLTIEMKTVGDISTTNVTGTTIWGAQGRPGIIQNPARKVHVRELVPGGTVGAGTDYYFMRENGAGEGDPTAVAEGNAKPQFDFDLVESSVKIETLAGWVRVTRKAMQNIPGFLSFLQARMPQRLLNVEDAETLYGSGTSPHLKGILTAGNYTASTSTSTSLSEAIIDDLATLEDTYERMGTAIILRPIDYWSFFKQKASGSGEYDLPDNFTFQNGTLYVSGVPVYETTALTAGDYVVGDFQDGAQLLIQNPWRLEFSDSDASNFTTNKVTIRIEEDVAFPVYGSTYFIKGVVPTAV